MRVRIKTTPIQGIDLRPGDLYSALPAAYWRDGGPWERIASIGEMVWIRTNQNALSVDDADSIVQKIEIIVDEEG